MNFLRTFLSGLCCIIFFACKSNDSANLHKPTTSAKSFEAMSTFMTLKSYGPNSQKANESVEEMIANIEAQISTTNKDSYIYKINNDNNREEKFIDIPPQIAELIEFSLKMAKKTNGAFNPVLYPIVHLWGFTTAKYKVPADFEIEETLAITDFNKVTITKKRDNSATITMKKNMMIDMGAVGKGFAGDQAIQMMKEMGITSAIIDLGGNVQTLGCKPDGSPWKIGITNPWGEAPIGGIAVCDKAVITSGGYERFFEENGKRYIHIFDGKKGKPVENNLAAVTVIAKSGLFADALSTALFAMGKEKSIEFWKKNHEKFQMILVMNDKSVAYTEELTNTLTITNLAKDKKKITS